MKLKNVFCTLFILLSLTSFGQEKIIRIGPGPLPKQPEPIFILDGIGNPGYFKIQLDNPDFHFYKLKFSKTD